MSAANPGEAPPPPATLVRLEPVDRRGLRVRLVLDHGDALEVARAVLDSEGVGAGDPVDDALRARLVDRDLRWRAREMALGLLDLRPRSRAEVRRHLRRKDVPAAVAAACVEDLVEAGLLDDAAFARAWVRDRIRLKPRGRRRLLAELRQKGVERAVGEAAVDDVFAEAATGEEALAVDVALKWLRTRRDAVAKRLAAPPFTPEREQALRRLRDYLARRGFGGAALGRAVEAATRAAGEGPAGDGV